MKTIAALCLGFVLVAVPCRAQGPRKEVVHFKAGASSAAISGKIEGDQDVDYVLGAKAGQTLKVTLKSSNRFHYFNVLSPGSEEALFVGADAAAPNAFEAKLTKDGDHVVRLYLMRNAARRGELAIYTITFSITGGAAGAAAKPPAAPQASATTGAFDKRLELLGVSFRVSCPNDSAKPTLTITPSGLANDNSPLVSEVEGRVVGAEVADLNADLSPEIYVYAQGAGPRPRSSLVADSANRKKSLSAIYLPPFAEDPKMARGYRGGDDMAAVEGTFVVRFPIYKDGDADGTPTGGTRQIQYKLAQGEASWVLRADKVMDF